MAKKHPKIKKLIYVVLFPFSDFFFLQKNPKITKLIYVVLFPFRIKNFANSTTLPTPPQTEREKNTASFYGFNFLLEKSFKRCLKMDWESAGRVWERIFRQICNLSRRGPLQRYR
jgi:hypothetical protein